MFFYNIYHIRGTRIGKEIKIKKKTRRGTGIMKEKNSMNNLINEE
jgi:hypothetical protein